MSALRRADSVVFLFALALIFVEYVVFWNVVLEAPGRRQRYHSYVNHIECLLCRCVFSVFCFLEDPRFHEGS